MQLDDVGVVGGGIALALLAFLPWYTAAGTELRGWDLGWTAVVAVLLAAYAAGRVLWVHDKPQKADVPVTPPAETFAAAFAALALMAYRLLDVPSVPGTPVARTNWLVAATAVVAVQAVFAGRKLRRTGLRPS